MLTVRKGTAYCVSTCGCTLYVSKQLHVMAGWRRGWTNKVQQPVCSESSTSPMVERALPAQGSPPLQAELSLCVAGRRRASDVQDGAGMGTPQAPQVQLWWQVTLCSFSVHPACYILMSSHPWCWLCPLGACAPGAVCSRLFDCLIAC